MTLVVPLLAALVAAAAVLVWPGRAPSPCSSQAPVPPGTPVTTRRASPGGRPRAAGRHGRGSGEPATRAAPSGRVPVPDGIRQLVRWLSARTGALQPADPRRPADPRADPRRPADPDGPLEEVQLLDGLAAALEAGLPMEHAVRVALPPVVPGQEEGAWSDLARAARAGHPLGPAWQRLARRSGSPTAASVARAWTVAGVTGAPVAAAVRSSAHAARERRRLERTVEVATAGARATATVLGLLPLAGVGLAALVGVDPSSLYAQPLALASAGAGAVLLLVGHLVVRRMVGQVLRGVL